MANYYYLPEHQLACLWSPKVGCTTLSNWLAFDILGLSRPPTGRKLLDEHNYRSSLDELQSLHQAGKLQRTLVTARHPAERMASVFNFFFIQRRKKPVLTANELDTRSLEFLRRTRLGFDRQDHYIGLSFAEFVHAIKTRVRWLSPLDHHFSPQICSRKEAKFLLSLDNAITFIDIRDYGRDLPEIAATLTNVKTAKISQKNRLVAKREWEDDETTGNETVSSLTFARNRKLPTKASLMGETIHHALARGFKRDFDLFGYEHRDLSQTPQPRVGGAGKRTEA